MRKVMHEMRDADVHFISLVDKSSSRIPFRIQKHDDTGETMIDLSLLRRKTEDPKAATVSGVIVQSQPNDADNVRIKEAIKSAGFSVDTLITKDEGKTFLYVQEPEPLKDVVLVRMSDQLVLAVKGFQPQHPDMKDADFGASASANGFYQGLDSSLDVFFSKVCDAVGAAKSEVDAAAAVGKLCDGLKLYATGMVKGLPAAAFKADIAIRDIAEDIETVAAKKADTDAPTLSAMLVTPPKGIAQNDWGKMSDVDKMKWVLDSTNKPVDPPSIAGSASKGEDCAKCKATAGWDAMSADEKTATHAKHTAEKTDETPDAGTAAILAAIGELNTKVTTISTKVDGVEAAQTALKTVVDANDGSVKALATKMEGIVTAPAPPVDNMTVLGTRRVVEKDDDPRTGNFDTAFLRGGVTKRDRSMRGSR